MEEEACDPANQEALFVHFELILDHMSRVRKATTCAGRVLEANPANCGAVTGVHLFIQRVATSDNIADLPSRRVRLACQF